MISTLEQIAALAPDDASLKAAKGLLSPAKWPTLGKSADALWGECQGSGSKPYQVTADLQGPAFKCTCPSRKFPCKHGLALMICAVERPPALKPGEPPAWAADWLASRRGKAEKKAQAAEKPAAPPDPEAAARRAAKRLERMKEGGAELARWLADQARIGIASAPQRDYAYFGGVAARMVDAQAPGLGNEVLRFESIVRGGDGWPERALAQLGRMHLLVEALARFESLPESLQSSLKAALGWPVEKEEVIALGEKVEDRWTVAGQVFTERDKLWERRTWLLGRKSRRAAMLLDFSHGNRNFPVSLALDSAITGTVAYFPDAHPLRAVLTDAPKEGSIENEPLPGCSNFAAAMEAYAEALAGNPWLSSIPLSLESVLPVRRRESLGAARCRWRGGSAADRGDGRLGAAGALGRAPPLGFWRMEWARGWILELSRLIEHDIGNGQVWRDGFGGVAGRRPSLGRARPAWAVWRAAERVRS